VYQRLMYLAPRRVDLRFCTMMQAFARYLFPHFVPLLYEVPMYVPSAIIHLLGVLHYPVSESRW